MSLDYQIRSNIPEIGLVTAMTNLDWEHLKRQIAGKGYVGLAPGVFDMLHPGHLEFLCWAKARCDYLIVSIATDESVISLKQIEPVFNATQRAFMVASTKYVDAVTSYIYGELLDIVKVINPDALFQGLDRVAYLSENLSRYLGDHNIDYIVHPREGSISSKSIYEFIKNNL
jgi:cytidyltransferase-like protein